MLRVSQGFEGNRDEMQRTVMSLENEKIALLDNFNMLKRELDAKSTQLEYERSRTAQLEDVLMRVTFLIN